MSRANQKHAWLSWVPALVALAWLQSAVGFSFSEYEQQEREQQHKQSEATQGKIRQNLATECPSSAKQKRIVLLVSESGVQGLTPWYRYSAAQGQLAQYVNDAFRKLGFRTYSQKQITDQIAEAELQAVANGDPDAAMSAAQRLAADYVLKARVSSRSLRNPMLGIMEVYVDMGFELQSATGDLVGSASASSDAFSGEDTVSVARTLARGHAPTIASELYRSICRYESANKH